MIGPHRLRRKLAEQSPAFGPIINFNSPWFVDIAGLIGFDFVTIDCEHGPMSVETVEALVRAAEAAGISPVVRVPCNQPHEILRVLDVGATGIKVPHVETLDDAAAAARAIRYHRDAGARGLAMSTRAAGYGIDMKPADYMEISNREVIFLCMVETWRAVENIEAILAVEGVDVIAIGPNDLAQSMGYGGDRAAAAVEQAIDHVIEQARTRGTPVSLPATDASSTRRCLERGAQVVQIGSAAWLVHTGRKLLEDVK